MAVGSRDVRSITGLTQTERWNGKAKLGTPVAVTYSFATKPPDYDDSLDARIFGMSKGQKASIREALDLWSRASGIVFLEVPEAVGGGQIRFSMADLSAYAAGDKLLAFFARPPMARHRLIDGVDKDTLNYDTVHGDIWLNSQFYAGASSLLAPGSEGFRVLLHSIGRSIGFKNTQDGRPKLPAERDNTGYTVMSNDFSGPAASRLGSIDLEAVKLYYGARPFEYKFSKKSLTLEIVGTAKAETLLGTELSDTIHGGGGGDTMQGEPGRDILRGNAGDDVIYGGSGNDQLFGGKGDDALFGEKGHDTLKGDAGNDRLHGGHGNDLLEGGEGDDELKGGEGNDVLVGGPGTNILEGGEGNDLFLAGPGADTFVWGTVSYQNAPAGIVIVFDDPSQNQGDAGNDTFEWIGRVIGTPFDDRIVSGNNTYGATHLQGGGGDDELRASDTDSILEGGGGNDLLVGGDREDQLKGGAGDDVLEGGGLGDQLTGGRGADRFVFSDILASTRDFIDTILDFRRDEGDKFDVSMDHDEYVEGQQGFEFIGTSAFSRHSSNELRTFFDGKNTIVTSQHIGGIRFSFKLPGHVELEAGDFIL